MTKRPQTMKFMGGMFVFPGGALDKQDVAPSILARCSLTPAEAVGRVAGTDDGAKAVGLHVAALRETFEEVGVLLAHHTDGSEVDQEWIRRECLPRREEIAHEFPRFCEENDLLLLVDRMKPFGRLVTPEISPIRFDARFFISEIPEGAVVDRHLTEVDEILWISPAEAIASAGRGEIEIPIPTMAILKQLAEAATLDDVGEGLDSGKILVTEHGPGIVSVLAPNPGLFTGPGTNTWIVGSNPCVIIDPGCDDPRYLERLITEAGNRGGPSALLLTHHHPDHTEGVERILAFMPRLAVKAFSHATHPAVTELQPPGPVDGVGGVVLEAIHTPGHASDHLAFWAPESGVLFAGDVVSGIGTTVINPPDGNMTDYKRTLEGLIGLSPSRIMPGHGPVIVDGEAKLREYLAHRLDREQSVLEAVDAGAATVEEIVSRIYTDVPPKLHRVAERSVLAHLEDLARQGRVTDGEYGWTVAG